MLMSIIRHGGPSKQTNPNSHQSRYRANKSQPSMPARSRSENPINRSRQGGFTYLPESGGSNSWFSYQMQSLGNIHIQPI